jgi:hypothetical protein
MIVTNIAAKQMAIKINLDFLITQEYYAHIRRSCINLIVWLGSCSCSLTHSFLRSNTHMATTRSNLKVRLIHLTPLFAKWGIA